MKPFEIIKLDHRFVVRVETDKTLIGIVTLKDQNNKPVNANCIIGRDEDGFEHVSVSPMNLRYLPGWKNMVQVKDMCWEDEEEVIQIMPKKSEYVNIMPNCLHLWRKIDGNLWK